ncbi:MAG: DUF4221 domain-containing protein [Tannerella sp.]|jgi:hypothetical protein|nr:DUF4221 domain-containing protein [Tannerella sp.]
MQHLIRLSIPLFILFLFSCGGNNAGEDSVTLIKSEKTLSFQLDSETKSVILALFPYTDPDGKEYLTFQNARKNEILFYEMNTGKFLYKIKPYLEGPDGVGRLLGYHIKDLNTIYLTNRDRKPVFVVIDSTAAVKERINYGKDVNGMGLRSYASMSSIYQPIIEYDNKLYHTVGLSRFAEPNPATFTFDLNTKEIKALPFEHPVFPVSYKKDRLAGLEEEFSRCFDGTHFIYSYHFDESIYVTTPDHLSARKIPVKSRYVREVEFTELLPSGPTFKSDLESSHYGNLYFDPYRDVYYRLAYPKNEVEETGYFIDLLNYGRKVFSIIILNRDFQIIGETLFPEYIYNPRIMFIREDGLYICSSHFKNPDYSDDVLSFDCFRLEKKGKN